MSPRVPPCGCDEIRRITPGSGSGAYRVVHREGCTGAAKGATCEKCGESMAEHARASCLVILRRRLDVLTGRFEHVCAVLEGHMLVYPDDWRVTPPPGPESISCGICRWHGAADPDTNLVPDHQHSELRPPAMGTCAGSGGAPMRYPR